MVYDMTGRMELVWERDLRTLYSPQEVQTILRRERARADRTGRQLSMVVAELEEGGRRLLERLARVALSRARATDEIGWFAYQQLCVILPDTDSSGACAFAQSLCELARQNALRIACSIYTYPSVKSPRGGNGQDKPDEPCRGKPTEELPGRAELAGSDRRQVGRESPIHVASIQPLEELFIRPLPLWKRMVDIIGGAIGLVVSAPIVAISAAIIKLTSKGPVVFRQVRAGLAGRPFRIYKLRTMVMDAEQQQLGLRKCSEQDGPAFKMTSDPRVTAVGRLLRTMSLDELPQFWNVLKGEMSLVGPRPLPVVESDACAQWHRKRLEVTPGLTCIWQVRGRSRVTFDEWMRMDMEYIRHRNIFRDLKLLVLTVTAVILRRGAH